MPTGLRVDVDASSFLAQLGRVRKAVDVVPRRHLKRLALRVVEKARAIAPVQVPNQRDPIVHDAGKLRDSIHLEERNGGFEVVADVSYAETAHEDLTARHDVGQAKFIEEPFYTETQDDSVIAAIADEIAGEAG